MSRLRRGMIYIADLNPPRGTEPGKMRPVLVIQTNLINDYHPSTLICPLTTNIQKHTKYLRVHLTRKETGLDKDSDVMVDQLRAIDNNRLKTLIGQVSQDHLTRLEKNIKILLDLN